VGSVQISAGTSTGHVEEPHNCDVARAPGRKIMRLRPLSIFRFGTKAGSGTSSSGSRTSS
jgi:hypothetical protein